MLALAAVTCLTACGGDPAPLVTRPLSPPATAPAAPPHPSPDAPDVVSLLQQGAYEQLWSRFSPKMKEGLSAAALQQLWEEQARLHGPLQRVDVEPRRHQAVYRCTGGAKPTGLRVHLDHDARIVGIFFAKPRAGAEGPAGTGGTTTLAFERADEFMTELAAGRYAAATAPFEPAMKEAVPAEALAAIAGKLWPGKPSDRGCVRSDAVVTARFLLSYVQADLLLKVHEDGAGTVIGMFVSGQYRDPSYALKGSYDERAVVVGQPPWELPATLTLPRGGPPRAAVVLVHGSGPNDRNESVGAAKPFRDLALGLASRGLAVLRYDKRTKVHGAKMKGWPTLDEETVDDVLAAAALLRRMERTEQVPVFVLGHSMGGKLVPRIGQRDGAIAGFIIAAGSTQPLEDILEYQIPYLLEADGAVTPGERQEIEKVRAQAARVRARQFTDDTPAEELLDTPPARWREWHGYDAPTEALKLKRPLLILQGERDYQVTMKDFEGWQKTLAGQPGVTLHSFPKLNHLLIPGEGKSVPAEYDEPGNVAPEIIDTLTRWIDEQSGASDLGP